MIVHNSKWPIALAKMKFLLLLLFVFLPTFADAVIEIDGIYYILYPTTNEAKVTYGRAYSGIVDIPSSITYKEIKYSVTNIGDKAFYRCSGLASINIPNSVTRISPHAFMGCSGLTSINIPNSVTTIDQQAFRDCTGLTSISIPNSVTKLEQNAFQDCRNLLSVTICTNNFSISYNTFSGCRNIKKLIYAEGCTKATSTGLVSVSEVILPQTLLDISDNAFSNFKNLKTISIPISVTTISQEAFSGCSGLTNINLSNSMTTIGSGAFEDYI